MRCPHCDEPIADHLDTCPICNKDVRPPARPPKTIAAPPPALPDLTPAQRALFDAEFEQVAKNPGTAQVLAFLLGGLGMHHFYMGQWAIGLVYLAFCWTYVPILVGLIEAFFMGSRVRRYNEKKARLIEARIRVAAESRNHR